VLYNPYWSAANNVLTVYYALEQLNDDIAIINSDVIAEEAVYALFHPDMNLTQWWMGSRCC